MATLLLAEVANGHLADIVAKALTAATQLGEPVDVLVAGRNVGAAAEAASSLAGDYSAIVAGSSAFSKNVMPRVAALLDVMQVSDIIRVVSPDTFERPIYAGNAIQTVQTDRKSVV